MRIELVLHHAYGMGGTIRSVLTLAGELARRHDVTVVSAHRHRDEPFFPPPRGVALHPLIDHRPGTARGPMGAARTGVSRIFPPGEAAGKHYGLAGDAVLVEYLARSRADAVIGTRAGLNLAVARYGRRPALRLAQEHVPFLNQPEDVVAAMSRWYPVLDGLGVLTADDATSFGALLGLQAPAIQVIPNGVLASPVAPAELDAPLIVAAGRLESVKRYDRLIDAFALLRDDHPAWRLRIFGHGSKHAALKRQILRLGLSNEVQLMGLATRLYEELAKASIGALSSRTEGLPTFLVEAMTAGVPVVSFDCPVGPRAIIDHGVDGLLVPPADVPALAAALAQLMGDPPRRRAMGHAARESSERFRPAAVAAQWEDFISRLGGTHQGTRRRGGRVTRRLTKRPQRTGR